MAEIQILSNETIDKIAAGEVVERPASVVKELVENAIDAGATAVTVEIKEGGISLIRVTDNGFGIDKQHIRTAFLRHATSKIRSVEDLLACTSLGFRGEALSSIAAVSQVEFMTKTKESLTGVRYVIEGTAEKELEDIGAPEGSTIVVRNLFFNTPARRKFLKTAQTEGSYVSDLMEHLAMSKPEISFKYVNNGQMKFHTSGNKDLKEIIYRIYGKDIIDALLTVTYQCEDVTIHGFLGKPTINRANRNFENYFVNRRYIKSDLVSKAIEEGYKPFLMQHKFPFAVLNIEMDPNKIDVNVHPAKMEVRFSNQNELFQTIVTVVSDSLNKKELIPEVVIGNKKDVPQDMGDPKSAERAEAGKVPEPFEQHRIQAEQVREESGYKGNNTELQAFLQKTALGKVIGQENSSEVLKNAKNNSNVLKSKDLIFVEKPSQLNLFEDKLLTKEARSEYKILGQLFDTYWLVAFSDKLFIVDQHAAHEKVKYENLVRKLNEKEVTSQSLNPPVIITLSGKEELVWKQFEGYFYELGFEVEAFGGNEYAIRGVPADLYGCNEKQFFEEILDELHDNIVKGSPAVMKQKLASMSCKAAVKGNTSLSVDEFGALLDQLLELENPYHCPHGRPTIISMSKYEIEKKFKRIL